MNALVSIPTTNLDNGSDNPGAARGDILEAVTRLNTANEVYLYGGLTLATAATAGDAAGKTVVVTSPITVTTAIAWPTDRALRFEKGGVITFTGSGALTGLKEAQPEYFGAVGDGTTDDTTAWQKAIAAATTVNFSNKPYKITDTLKIQNVDGFSLIGENASFADPPWATSVLNWFGAADRPMLEISHTTASGAVALGITIKNLTLNGYPTGATYRAKIGISFGTFGSATVNLAKFITTDKISIKNCRIGASFGANAGVSSDIAHHAHTVWNVSGNTDFGVYVATGNAAAINFISGLFGANGYSPTTDALNASGYGANICVIAGELILTGSSSAGSDASAPATADILMFGNGLKINSHWSDADGMFLKQSGPLQTLALTGVRHYNSTMTDSDTPTSMYITGKALLTGCYLFGDVQGISGASGSITSIGNRFYAGADLATRRPSLGIGTFKGDIITTQKGLISLNDKGNNAQMIVGGGTRSIASVGYPTPQLLSIGTGFANASLLQVLGAAATDPGFNVTMDPNSGAINIFINCYVYDASANIRAHTIGNAYRIVLGSGAAAQSAKVLHYYFSSTSTSIALSSFVDMGGWRQGGPGSETQYAFEFPKQTSAPSYSSGDWWEGCVYYNTTTNKLEVNVGAGTWQALN